MRYIWQVSRTSQPLESAIICPTMAWFRWPVLIVLLTVLVACGEPDVAPSLVSPAQAPASAATSPLASEAATVRVEQHPDLGAILVDSGGNTLYLYTGDERGVSNCYQGCEAAWPPLLTAGDPIGGEGAESGRVGTTTRTDGSSQVTFNGWPLYRFAADETPSSTMGQNVGGVFFAVSTYGGPIQSAALVKVSQHPDLGDILVDASGRLLYLFTADERNLSNCLGGCATAWPPMITIGEPLGDEGTSAGRLGTITREDGYLQVAYNGWPLYYYVLDRKPGDAKGQNSGDIWFVVSTYGGPIQTNAVVKTSDHANYGTILTDASGRTLYSFADDERDMSNCTRGCPLARIHRRTSLGTALEEASGCSSESGIMVLEQKPARKQGAPNRCCHRTNPTVSASSLTTIA